MKRFFVVLLCAFVLVNYSFAYDGVFSGEKKLSVVKTQWFDIIYEQTSEEVAGILFEKVDAIYEDIASDYGIMPQFRMPVVITSSLEEFNAYWSSYPYNHIVIYDTGTIEDLKVFSESLVSTFRHELTHAVSYNLRSPFLQKVDKIFGDPVNPAPLIITKGWAEGATLTNESKYGEGRLNDEYSKQMVRQAKIEGIFPHYADIQGASDLYPYGAFYYFNGAFAQYLQETYGIEKYARFWYLCVNFGGLTAKGNFKKAYGLNLYDVWADFEAAYQVPELREIQQEDVCDNNSGAVYSSLTVSQKGIAFIENQSSSVYFISRENLCSSGNPKGENQPKKLFYNPELNDIRFSDDGRFLVIDVTRENKATAKKSIDIYCFDSDESTKGSCFRMAETGLRDGCILSAENKYYLVCQNFISQHNSIKIFNLKLDEKQKKILSADEVLKIDFPIDVIPYSFTSIGDGKFAFIKKDKMNYSICLCDLQGNIFAEYSAPEDRMVLRYLSFNGKNLLFSWTKPGSLPRFGKLIPESETFVLQDFDVSGGVYWPVAFDDAENLFYIGSFFRQNKIFTGQIDCVISKNKLTDKGEAPVTVPEAKQNYFESSTAEKTMPSAFQPQNYNPFDYYTRGVLIPFSKASSVSYLPEAETSYLLPWGLTYITSNPWTNGFLIVSAGYGFSTNSAGVEATYSSGTDTSLFNYSVTTSLEFDRHFWKQSSISFNVNSVWHVGNISYLVFSNNILAYYGRPNKALSEEDEFNIGYRASDNLSNYFYANDTFSVTYTNVHKTGPGRYEKGGIKFSALCSYILNAKSIPFREIYQNGGQAGFRAAVYIPKLFPLKNRFRYTYNLPSKISFHLFTRPNITYSLIENNISLDLSNFNTGNLPVYNAAFIQAETILFGYDFQKAIPGLRSVFANDFNVSFVYAGGFSSPEDLFKQNWKILYLNEYLDRIKSNEMKYSYYLSLKSTVGLTPNFGGLASYYNKMMVCAQVSWLSSNKVVFDFGLDVAF